MIAGLSMLHRRYSSRRQDHQHLPTSSGNGPVFQSYALFPHMSVAENITSAPNARKSKETIRVRSANRTSIIMGEDRLQQLRRSTAARASSRDGYRPESSATRRATFKSRRIASSRLLTKCACCSVLRLTTIMVTHDQRRRCLWRKLVVMREGRILQSVRSRSL